MEKLIAVTVVDYHFTTVVGALQVEKDNPPTDWFTIVENLVSDYYTKRTGRTAAEGEMLQYCKPSYVALSRILAGESRRYDFAFPCEEGEGDNLLLTVQLELFIITKV